MIDFPIRLLISGYGLAAAAAAALAAGAGGLVGPLLVFWVGGAVAVIALAATPGVRRLFSRPSRPDPETEDAETIAALARWEADRRADADAARGDAGRRRA